MVSVAPTASFSVHGTVERTRDLRDEANQRQKSRPLPDR